jgi:hypothetical protein
MRITSPTPRLIANWGIDQEYFGILVPEAS